VYNNSTDALQQLLFLKRHGGRITKCSGTDCLLTNGVPFYFVEVTCEDGSQYGIQAYGEESRKLQEEVVRNTPGIVLLNERGTMV
jgi:hypothetical protein